MRNITICRFINADNYELVSQLAGSKELNMYTYCGNNPIMYTDPMGTSWFSDIWNVICGIYSNIQADIQNFEINNTDPQKVIAANYFSAYRGEFALKSSILDTAGFSFGIMVIGDNVTSANLIRHEYGHYLQLQEMGAWKYLFEVAIPSVTGFILEDKKKLKCKYLELPWEYDASYRGGDTDYRNYTPNYNITYWHLLKMFF